MYDLGKYVPRIYNSHERQQIDSKWRNLSTTTLPKQLFEKDIKIIDFYRILSRIIDNGGNHLFKQFATFALEVMSLPTSNADAKHLFFKLNLIKSDTRNRLQKESINALMHLSESFKSEGYCANHDHSQNMIQSIFVKQVI